VYISCGSRAMAASQEAKAYDLVAKAEKRLGSWLNLSGNKYDDAAELYGKAANMFKVSKNWTEAGKCFEQVAQMHLKLKSAHEAATAYTDAANCYKKTDSAHAVLLYKEAVAIQVDLGRFTTAAKQQKEIGELCEAENDLAAAMEAYQTAADFYLGEESTSAANQCLLKVAGFAAATTDYNKAVQIYEQVAIASLENTLLKWSVKDYLMRAGLCRLATGEIGDAVRAFERYCGLDSTFGTTREGEFLQNLIRAYENLDVDAFTDHVREFDEISRLDPQKTTLLLEVKNKMKGQQDDLT